MILGEPLRLSLMSREAIGANQALVIVVVKENDCQQVFFLLSRQGCMTVVARGIWPIEGEEETPPGGTGRRFP